MVVSYAGKGTVYSFRPDASSDQLTLLRPEPAVARPGMTPVLPVDFWGRNLSEKRPYQYISPDRSVFISTGEDFVEGQLYYGTKMADILRAFGLGKAEPGQLFYITDEGNEKTYKATVTDAGTITDKQLFAEEGGESVAQDKDGNVYLTAGQVLVYNRQGKLTDRIDVPERPIEIIFGGVDRRTLYILTHASLYAVSTRSPGW